MSQWFRTQGEYRRWILGTIILLSFISKDFTLLMSSFWIGWTVSKVQDGRIDIIVKQVFIILIATLIGLIIGYKFSVEYILTMKGWI